MSSSFFETKSWWPGTVLVVSGYEAVGFLLLLFLERNLNVKMFSLWGVVKKWIPRFISLMNFIIPL